MLAVLKAKIPVWQESCGATVVLQEQPIVVCIITGIMQRAHTTQFAHDICFVDSTASCDGNNTVITFMLAPTVAGAVPLAVLLTDSTCEASYSAAFQLLRTTLPADAFGGQQFPAIFVTDDSDAERNALRACWPQAVQRLCLFHVAQAVWRWLWAETHRISKEDRQQLMTEFRKVMYACDVTEAENLFQEAMDSDTAEDYDNYRDYLSKLWERRELWCLAFRNAQHRGHHTNNFAEVTVRLYKDIVLRRAKAYNPVALVDFTARVLEEYYRMRLRDFANGRISAQRLLFDKLVRKVYLTSPDQVTNHGNGTFDVPGSDGTELYRVDATVGCCSCRDGMHGKFCKHQLAIMQLFATQFPNAPGVSSAARHTVAYVALGAACPPVSFYQDLIPSVSDCVTASAVDNSTTTVQLEHASSASQADNTEDSVCYDTYIQLLRDKFTAYGADATCQFAVQTAISKLQSVSSPSALASYLHNTGYRRFRTGAAIRVQPTAVSRRKPGVTRGSKRLAAGRPLGTSSARRAKRRRCLAHSILNNVPNAKSHN